MSWVFRDKERCWVASVCGIMGLWEALRPL